MLREAGALEVHVRISSPPVKWPCFYGIDFATRAELIANGLDDEEIRASIGADSLGYISLDGMIEATGQPSSRRCARRASPASTRSPLPDESLLGKHLLEATLSSPTLGRALPSSTTRDGHRLGRLRRGRRLDRGRRPRGRPDEGLGRQGPPPGDDRRHRGLRRAVRRIGPDVVQAAPARHLDRRSRHQGRDRPGDGRPRHDRVRPGRHGRRRPRGLRRRAAVHDRLHRLRPGRARADRGHRQGHRRGLRRGRLRAGRRRDRRAPGAARTPTSTTSPARPRVWSRPTTCSARPWSAPATPCSRWRPAGCTPTATRSSATSSPRPAGRYDRDVPELGRTLGEELLEPTRIYAKACLALARAEGTGPGIHAMAHVTGGGLAANLARVMPEELTATLERGTWAPPPIFDLVRRAGGRPAAGPRGHAQLRRRHGRAAGARAGIDAAISLLDGFGIHAWVAGEVSRRGWVERRHGVAGRPAPRLALRRTHRRTGVREHPPSR